MKFLIASLLGIVLSNVFPVSARPTVETVKDIRGDRNGDEKSRISQSPHSGHPATVSVEDSTEQEADKLKLNEVGHPATVSVEDLEVNEVGQPATVSVKDPIVQEAVKFVVKEKDFREPVKISFVTKQDNGMYHINFIAKLKCGIQNDHSCSAEVQHSPGQTPEFEITDMLCIK